MEFNQILFKEKYKINDKKILILINLSKKILEIYLINNKFSIYFRK
jgi:hypothetical protein